MKYIKLFVIIAILALLSTEVLAEENNDNVQIQLPEFEITINNQKLEDIEKLYHPFFVYKDIVYIHRENLECLGIRITLSDNILICQKSIDDNLIERDISKLRRGNEVFQNKASIFSVISRIRVTNYNYSEEKEIVLSDYPVLLYEGAICIPLTYEITADLFGCSYSFTENSGFEISADEIPAFEELFKIPEYPITLNGAEYDNENAEIKIYSHNDVVYLPLSREVEQYLGFHFHIENGRDAIANISIGNAPVTSETLLPLTRGTKISESGSYHYYFNVNNTFRKPFVSLLYRPHNINGTWYIPLTYDVLSTLEWEYGFDPIKGFEIDSRNTFKADYSYYVNSIGGGSFYSYNIDQYIFESDEYYVLLYTEGTIDYFAIGKRNGETSLIHLRDNGIFAGYYSSASIDGNRFNIYGSDLDIVVDLDTGEFVSIIEK